nr:MAG TPA: hypothetical protein [Caudoviricetes sp.]
MTYNPSPRVYQSRRWVISQFLVYNMFNIIFILRLNGNDLYILYIGKLI